MCYLHRSYAVHVSGFLDPAWRLHLLLNSHPAYPSIQIGSAAHIFFYQVLAPLASLDELIFVPLKMPFLAWNVAQDRSLPCRRRNSAFFLPWNSFAASWPRVWATVP
jgi:hypothetical protein